MVHDFTGTGYDLSTSYGYNPAQQVLSASISNSGFVYGASSAGTTGYSVNGLNQYTALSGLNAEALGYDAKGNLTSDGSFTYGYDAENRLTTAVSSSVTASYGYDPLGRRYQKTVNGTVTSYLSAGDELIADYDSAGNLTYRYVPGAGTDQPIARITSGGTIEYVHADRQGSVIALANDTGTLSAGPYSYSSFGAGGSLSGVEFQYTGRQIDPETGLYYYRARYYSPALGRFLQTDPVGYEDDINWYAYVGNDPMNVADPSGMYIAACSLRDDICDRAEEEFEYQRQLQLQSRDEKEREAAIAYGEPGKDNSVTVEFVSTLGAGIDSQTVSRIQGEFANITDKVLASLSGDSMAHSVAHEGPHILNIKKYAKSYNAKKKKYNQKYNMTVFQDEFAAFTNELKLGPDGGIMLGPDSWVDLSKRIMRDYPNYGNFLFQQN